MRQKNFASLNIPQVWNFARISVSGYRPVGPASQDNFINISENHLCLWLATAETMMKKALCLK